jgi:indolepyruvate ferredoxin oxidoreductase beta subunit
MKSLNIFMTGVGGQGIGMLSEILVRAVDYAGYRFKGVDTHGLAQRGGIVVSQLRIGENVHSPLIEKGDADIVIALERHEALRAGQEMLKPEGTLIWYDTSWQPLPIRLGTENEVQTEKVMEKIKGGNIRVFRDDLPDTRMQNIAVLSSIIKNNLVEGLTYEVCEKAMADLMPEKMLKINLDVLKS